MKEIYDVYAATGVLQNKRTDGRTRRHVRVCVDGGVFVVGFAGLIVWVGEWEAFGFRFFACFWGNRMETQACGPGILWKAWGSGNTTFVLI